MCAIVLCCDRGSNFGDQTRLEKFLVFYVQVVVRRWKMMKIKVCDINATRDNQAESEDIKKKKVNGQMCQE